MLEEKHKKDEVYQRALNYAIGSLNDVNKKQKENTPDCYNLPSSTFMISLIDLKSAKIQLAC